LKIKIFTINHIITMPARNRNQRRQPQQAAIQAIPVESHDQPIVQAEAFEENMNADDINPLIPPLIQPLLHRIHILEELNKTLTQDLKLAEKKRIQWSREATRYQNEIKRLCENEKRIDKYNEQIITEMKNDAAREFIHMENEIEHLRKKSIKSHKLTVKNGPWWVGDFKG
jgi:hypothetical protein